MSMSSSNELQQLAEMTNGGSAYRIHDAEIYGQMSRLLAMDRQQMKILVTADVAYVMGLRLTFHVHTSMAVTNLIGISRRKQMSESVVRKERMLVNANASIHQPVRGRIVPVEVNVLVVLVLRRRAATIVKSREII